MKDLRKNEWRSVAAMAARRRIRGRKETAKTKCNRERQSKGE